MPLPPLPDAPPFKRADAPDRTRVREAGRGPAHSRFALTLLTFAFFALALSALSQTSAMARPAERPPSPEEQKLFADGMRLLQAGDAAGAARAFQGGYEVGHDPAFLVRLGEAQEKNGAVPAAIASYQQYLRENPESSDREDVESRLARLTRPLAKPASDGADTAGAAVAPVAPGLPPIETLAPPALPRGPAAPTPVAPSAASAPAVSRVPVPQTDEEESLRPFADDDKTPHTRLNRAAWIGTGVTVALLGVAAFYGAKAGDKASDVDRLLQNFDPDTDVPVEYASVSKQYEADVREGKHDDRIAKGFAIAAGAAALTTVTLFVIDAVRPPERTDGKLRASVLPLATPQSAGMGLAWTF